MQERLSRQADQREKALRENQETATGMRRAVGGKVALVAMVAALFGIGPGAHSAAAESLYVLQAKGGVLTDSKLVLHGVAARVSSFTDRPQRSAGSLPASRFAGRWGSIFGSDPPNAALEVQGVPADRDVALLELRRPRYDAARHTLTYSVRRLPGLDGPGLASFDRRGDGGAVKRFGRSSLFVDGGGETTIGTVQVKVAAGATVALNFSNTTVGYEADGVHIVGINTPSTGDYGQYTSAGAIDLTHTSMRFQASEGGGGMVVQMFVYIADPPSGPIAGEAQIPGGCSVKVILDGGEAKELANGVFSLPT
jgi:hypothetical protein